MLGKERQNLILEMLNISKTVQITDLTEKFKISVATARRDLDELESAGLIKRVYGGAVLVEKSGLRPIFNARIEQNSVKKAQIGMAAASLVSEGDTVVLDIGTTTLEVAKCIGNIPHLTVLTNSLPVLNELVQSDANVYALGGRLRSQELALSGTQAEEQLSNFCVDKAFIGAGGVTLENGITNYNPDSAQLCAAIIRRAKEVILVTDSNKFGKDGFAVVGKLNCVNTIVTDSDIPKEYLKAIEKMGVKLVIANQTR